MLVGDSEVFPAIAESSLREGVERILRGKGFLDVRMLLSACLSDSGGHADQEERSDRSVQLQDPKNGRYFVGAGEVVFQRSAEAREEPKEKPITKRSEIGG